MRATPLTAADGEIRTEFDLLEMASIAWRYNIAYPNRVNTILS
jgi:hypothetical protein